MKISPEISVSLEELTKYEHLASGFSLLPRQPVHSVLSGKHASKLRGRGLDFSEVRKYVHGDDIRNIDWKVTARTKVTHTKVFNEEKERPTFIILDQSSSMFFASRGSVKSVLAARLAALGGYKVLKSGDRIGGIIFDDEGFESVKPRRNRQALMHFLEMVVQKNQKLVGRKKMLSKEGMINKVLYRAANMISHDYVVLVISDFQHIDKLGYQYLSSIARHNDVISVFISDPLEMELPVAKFPVGDGEHQVLLSGKQSIRKKYARGSQELRTEALEYCRKYGIPVMEFSTEESLEEQIKKIFGKK